MTPTYTAPPRTVAQLFLRAARILQKRGFARQAYVDSEGCVCTLGALYLAAGLQPRGQVIGGFNSRVRAAAIDRTVTPILRDFIEGVNFSVDILTWNDSFFRTAADVLRVFGRAAADLRADQPLKLPR